MADQKALQFVLNDIRRVLDANDAVLIAARDHFGEPIIQLITKEEVTANPGTVQKTNISDMQATCLITNKLINDLGQYSTTGIGSIDGMTKPLIRFICHNPEVEEANNLVDPYFDVESLDEIEELEHIKALKVLPTFKEFKLDMHSLPYAALMAVLVDGSSGAIGFIDGASHEMLAAKWPIIQWPAGQINESNEG